MEQITQRTQKWDILKFLMIFLVVLGHATEYFREDSQAMRNLYMFIYTIHMPVFVFVSGMFSKRTVNEKQYDKILGYLILSFVLKLLPFAYWFADAKNIGINLFSDNGVRWFMFALFAFNLLTISFKNYSPVYITVLAVIFSCFAGYDNNVNDYLSLSRIIVFYPFFYLGYCLDREKLEKICKNKILKVAALAVIGIFVAFLVFKSEDIYFFRPLVTGRRAYHALEDLRKWGFLLRLAYYAITALVGFSVIVLVPKKTPLGICAKLGQRTLAVYSFHYVAIFYIFEKYKFRDVVFEKIGKGGEWLIIPISIAITLFFSLGIFQKLLVLIMNVPKRKNNNSDGNATLAS